MQFPMKDSEAAASRAPGAGWTRCLLAGLLLAASGGALALGTDAGREIATAAQAEYRVAGVAQTPVLSNVAQTFVDELLDVVVVADDAGPVSVASPQTGAVVQFTVTNSGNGEEAFRLVADPALGADDFDPSLDQLFLESNGMSKGQIYINCRNAGRYFVATHTGKKVPPQSRYYLPEPWLNADGENELILFDEHGRTPNKCKLVYDPLGPYGD